MIKQPQKFMRAAWVLSLMLAVVAPVVFVSSVAAKRPGAATLNAPQRQLPNTFDVRGPDGPARGTDLRPPTAAQLKAINALQAVSGVGVQVRYNGLTATPSHLFSYAGYLSAPSSAPPETVARNFINRWKGVFRFSQDDVDRLRLKSRAFVRDLGATILVFEQQTNDLPVYHGELMVNISRDGRVIDVGSETFPQLQLTNSFTLTPAQAIVAAANALNLTNFNPQSLGQTQVLRSFGDAPLVFATGDKFSRSGVFTDDIIVTRVAFPMGDTARAAYQFVLTTPQYQGIMWLNIVDAQTGQVLRRSSLTAFQRKNSGGKLTGTNGPAPAFGPPGGGNGTGRLSTMRPDVQDRLESNNNAGTAAGPVMDAAPTALSGRLGVGRSPAPGTPPTYAAESQTTRNSGRGFKFSLVDARRQNPLVYNVPFGQVVRGLPDAQNPSAESPFGWFYLPTGAGGSEITTADNNRATTQSFGYQIGPGSEDAQQHSQLAQRRRQSTLLRDAHGPHAEDARRRAHALLCLSVELHRRQQRDRRRRHANDNETTHGIGVSFDPAVHRCVTSTS